MWSSMRLLLFEIYFILVFKKSRDGHTASRQGLTASARRQKKPQGHGGFQKIGAAQTPGIVAQKH